MADEPVTELDGYTVGTLYWQQMWSPMAEHEPKTIKYGPRRLMKLAGIVPNWNGATRWWLVDPERPNDQSRMSWVESDWCDLEPAHEDMGMLF